MYSLLLRPLLFLLDAEFSHRLTLTALRALNRLPLLSSAVLSIYGRCTPALPVELMGISFRNPVGLAAGLDKNAECIEAFSDFGFGFIEVGTVTPRPQAGNPRPRLFRLTDHHAIINRMGFNNVGLAQFLDDLYRTERRCPVGINIGRNKDTPHEQALDDYLFALRAVYAHADYVTINISSPNTPGLRALQEGGALEQLLSAVKAEQAVQHKKHERYVPIALKIAPDLDDEQIDEIARLLRAHSFDAVIATNTTVSRTAIVSHPLAHETGGLSGQPLRVRSTEVIRRLYASLKGEIPIIGVGGIETAEHAWEKLVAGADLVQLYTAFIYQGPHVVRNIVRGLEQKVAIAGAASLTEAVAQARARG